MVQEDPSHRGAIASIKSKKTLPFENHLHGVAVAVVAEVIFFHHSSHPQKLYGSGDRQRAEPGTRSTEKEYYSRVVFIFMIESGSQKIKDRKILSKTKKCTMAALGKTLPMLSKLPLHRSLTPFSLTTNLTSLKNYL